MVSGFKLIALHSDANLNTVTIAHASHMLPTTHNDWECVSEIKSDTKTP